MGITFWCPKWGGNPKHVRIAVAFQNPLDGGVPGRMEGRHDGLGRTCASDPIWLRQGSSFEDLSLYPSVDAEHTCGYCEGWHGFITDGEVY